MQEEVNSSGSNITVLTVHSHRDTTVRVESYPCEFSYD